MGYDYTFLMATLGLVVCWLIEITFQSIAGITGAGIISMIYLAVCVMHDFLGNILNRGIKCQQQTQ
jgi:hypothetical protein